MKRRSGSIALLSNPALVRNTRTRLAGCLLIVARLMPWTCSAFTTQHTRHAFLFLSKAPILRGPFRMALPPLYTPLDKGKEHIRILHLPPGAFDTDIRCELSIELTKTSFEALSYVWGDTDDNRVIEVQGHQMEITPNLESALRHIRDESETRRLWVDALCINQGDNKERNHQVGIMGAIYKGAEKVIAWLGPTEEAQTDWARDIRRLSADPDLHWDPTITPNLDNSPDSSDELMLRLSRWLENSWHWRIWTLQEAVFAKSLIYIWGFFIFRDGQVDSLRKSFDRHFGHDRCCSMKRIAAWGDGTSVLGMTERILGSFNRYAGTAQLRDRNRPSTFIEVASKFRHRFATDPRDKVFAVLGLTNDLGKGIIDYDLDVAETYARVAFELIATTGNLEVLSHVLPYPGYRKLVPDGLLSWAPDWSYHEQGRDFYLRLLGVTARQERTSFNACHLTTASHAKRSFLTSLSLDGFFCDEIAVVGEEMNANNHDRGRVLEGWRSMVKVDIEPEQPYISGSTVLDAYWRTVCLDTDFDDSYSRANDPTRTQHDEWWEKFVRYMSAPPAGVTKELPPKITSRILLLTGGRRLFTTRKGYIGLAPEGAENGDQVWVLCGGRQPLVLRGRGDLNRQEYILLGDSYVHGIMNGNLSRKRWKTERHQRQ